MNASLGTVVETADGSLTLMDPALGESYHSIMGARRESFELYLEASGLNARWHQPSHGSENNKRSWLAVLDVGLGLGYNAITTIDSWLSSTYPSNLYIQSLEKESLLVESLASGVASWQSNWSPDLLKVAKSLQMTSGLNSSVSWSTQMNHPQHSVQLIWHIHLGDACHQTLEPIHRPYWDYIWQDPFSPEKNPNMWTSLWFQKVLKKSHDQTLLMTYSVARRVRDALTEAGWQWQKFPSKSGFKRHWLRASPMKHDEAKK